MGPLSHCLKYIVRLTDLRSQVSHKYLDDSINSQQFLLQAMLSSKMIPQHKGMVIFTGSMVWREMQEALSQGGECYLRGAAAVETEPLGGQRKNSLAIT